MIKLHVGSFGAAVKRAAERLSAAKSAALNWLKSFKLRPPRNFNEQQWVQLMVYIALLTVIACFIKTSADMLVSDMADSAAIHLESVRFWELSN